MIANPALVTLWQAVDETSAAYQAGKTNRHDLHRSDRHCRRIHPPEEIKEMSR